VSQGIATAAGFEGTLSGSFCEVQRYANWVETPRKQAINAQPANAQNGNGPSEHWIRSGVDPDP
jgi:hypothetical protein